MRENGYDIHTIHDPPGHKAVRRTVIDTHVLIVAAIKFEVPSIRCESMEGLGSST